jgi:PAB1-binding protein PBP1
MQVIRKKRLEVTETADDGNDQTTVDPANVGIILENEPVRLEGVVRADDPSEFQKPLELEKGWAKNLASRFQQQQEQSDGKRPFKLDVEIGAEPEVKKNSRSEYVTTYLRHGFIYNYFFPTRFSRTAQALFLVTRKKLC